MDELLITEILRKVSLTISVVGIVGGLDLIFGAKILIGVKRLLDRAYNFDKTINDPNSRKWLGAIMLFVSMVMLLLLITTK